MSSRPRLSRFGGLTEKGFRRIVQTVPESAFDLAPKHTCFEAWTSTWTPSTEDWCVWCSMSASDYRDWLHSLPATRNKKQRKLELKYGYVEPVRFPQLHGMTYAGYLQVQAMIDWRCFADPADDTKSELLRHSTRVSDAKRKLHEWRQSLVQHNHKRLLDGLDGALWREA